MSTTLPADPTGGLMSNLGTNVTTWVTTYGLPVFAGLVALGISISLAVSFIRRGAKQVAAK